MGEKFSILLKKLSWREISEWIIDGIDRVTIKPNPKLNDNNLTDTYPMDPVFLFTISYAPIESIWRQHQQEMPCFLYALQQIIIEFAGFESFNVDEHAETSQL